MQSDKPPLCLNLGSEGKYFREQALPRVGAAQVCSLIQGKEQ